MKCMLIPFAYYNKQQCSFYTRIWTCMIGFKHFFSHTNAIFKNVSLKDESKCLKKERSELKRKAMVEKLAKQLFLDSKVKEILENHTNKLARSLTYPDGIYILDRKIAGTILKIIKPKLSQNSDFFFEINPGPGIMTNVFLENGISRVRVFEKRTDFLPYLEDLQAKHRKLEIIKEDFLHLATITRRDMFTGEDTISSFFKDIVPTEWVNSPPLQIFAILPNSRKERSFLSFLLHSFQTFQNLFSFGRTQLFLFVSGKEFQYMVATPDKPWTQYRNISVLYQTLFDVALLHVEPRTSFFPPPTQQKETKRTYNKDNMYLVQLTPKKFLFEMLSPELLPEFGFFVLHHLTKRKCPVISSLDRWIPESSSYFTNLGLDVKTKFGELTAHQILVLYLHFSSMKEYPDSLFKTAAKMSDVSLGNFDYEEMDSSEGDQLS